MTNESKMFGVVSDVLMGKSLHYCETAEQAERDCYGEQGDECDDPDEQRLSLSNFRAWPIESWPDDLSFEEAFDWIGEQRKQGR